jgi:hypothetical protein
VSSPAQPSAAQLAVLVLLACGRQPFVGLRSEGRWHRGQTVSTMLSYGWLVKHAPGLYELTLRGWGVLQGYVPLDVLRNAWSRP